MEDPIAGGCGPASRNETVIHRVAGLREARQKIAETGGFALKACS
jgi:hypothetical protein